MGDSKKKKVTEKLNANNDILTTAAAVCRMHTEHPITKRLRAIIYQFLKGEYVLHLCRSIKSIVCLTVAQSDIYQLQIRIKAEH